jgi:hypothetical protein
LSQEKTLITHARTGAARFLSYEITVRRDDRRSERKRGGRRQRRSTNGPVALHVPQDVIKAKCAPYLARGKPARQPPTAAGRNCELCGQTAKTQVHQIHRLADLDRLGQTQPDWAVLMARKRRKTLMGCTPCHEGIHDGHETAAHGNHWRARCG